MKMHKALFITVIIMAAAYFTSLQAGMPSNEYSTDYSLYADSGTYIAQINNDKGTQGTGGVIDLNMHKLLGWTTLATAAATFAALGSEQEDLHCGLAHASTILAAGTCATGYYSYNDILGKDATYTVHAVLGTLATAGFAATVAHADGNKHAAVGSASGVMFVITVGILYF
jgi:hypothetical protein